MFKIMLDAGHYGKYNRSPSVPEYWESEMTWKLHNMWINKLAKYEDVTVGVTRGDQAKDLEVYMRGAKAKGYDVFVSLHSNAVGSYTNEDVVYPIVYKLKNDESGLANKLSNTVESVMKTGANPRIGTRLLDNGNEYYGVLRGAKAVGCKNAYIIEHSFHTATKSAKWLLDEKNLSRLAEAEVETIALFFGLKKKESEDEKMIEELKAKVDTLEKKNAALEEKIKKIQPRIYRYWADVEDNANWAYAPLKALHEAGLFSGRDPSDLDMPETLMRSLVCLAAALKKQGVINY